jgi:2-octaprenyl-6-methoxyphenol hydroxylase
MNKYKNKNYFFLKKRIKFYTKYFLKKVKFITGIKYKDLNLLIRKKYYQDRVLLFGDALHQVHPLAGQGFNMTLRDLASLEKTLTNKINLGLDIGSSDILSEFSDEIKPRNFVHSIGIDFIKNCFSFEKKIFKDFRNKIITKLNKNNFVKNQFLNFADIGFKL